eukprot:2747301-Amphidinium_carterae.2
MTSQVTRLHSSNPICTGILCLRAASQVLLCQVGSVTTMWRMGVALEDLVCLRLSSSLFISAWTWTSFLLGRLPSSLTARTHSHGRRNAKHGSCRISRLDQRHQWALYQVYDHEQLLRCHRLACASFKFVANARSGEFRTHAVHADAWGMREWIGQTPPQTGAMADGRLTVIGRLQPKAFTPTALQSESEVKEIKLRGRWASDKTLQSLMCSSAPLPIAFDSPSWPTLRGSLLAVVSRSCANTWQRGAGQWCLSTAAFAIRALTSDIGRANRDHIIEQLMNENAALRAARDQQALESRDSPSYVSSNSRRS